MTTRQMAREAQESMQEPLEAIKAALEGQVAITTGLVEVRVVIQGITAGDSLDANDAFGAQFEITVPERGSIHCASLIDPDDDTLAATAHLFTKKFTAAASDAAFTISAADSVSWVTSMLFDAPLDIGGAKVAEELNINKDYYAPQGKLWGQLSTTGTPSIATGMNPILVLFIAPAKGTL